MHRDGTGAKAAIPGYRVAGKTGTAQQIDETGRYSHEQLTSSFMGTAPASDPRFIALFVFSKPRTIEHGGELAAPVFRKVISEALKLYNIPPDISQEEQKKKRQSPVQDATRRRRMSTKTALSQVPFLGLTVREALHRATQKDVGVQLEGSGIAIQQEEVSPGVYRVWFSTDDWNQSGGLNDT